MFASEHVPLQTVNRQTPGWSGRWLSLFVVAFVVLGVLGDLFHIIQFPFDSASVEGTVVAIETSNHDAARVRYEVNGKEYEFASSFRPLTERGPTEFSVGQRVPVYYLRSLPSDASLQPPAELVSGALAQMGLLALLGASFASWLIHVWKRSGRTS
jgi:hypothetical protein